MNSLDSSILSIVDSNRNEQVEFLQQSIRTPSETGDEGNIAPLYEAALSSIGMDTRLQFVDVGVVTPHFPAIESEVNLAERPNVIGRLRSADNANAIVLNGHMDVVNPGAVELWHDGPFSGNVRDGRIYGRGASDMKGGLAVGIFAVKALVESGVQIHRDLEIQCVIAEETGGLGTVAASLLSEPADSAIVLEASDCSVATAQAGALRFELQIEGRGAHPSVPWRGVNAFDKLVFVYLELRRWAKKRDTEKHLLFARYPEQAPLAITLVRAGNNPGSIPDAARLIGRVGYLPGDDDERVKLEIEHMIAEIAAGDEWLKEHPPILRWGWVMPAWETSSDHPLVRCLRDASESILGGSEVRGVTAGTDASHISRLRSIPTVIFGPGSPEDGHHQPNESIALKQVLDATKVLALAMVRNNYLALTY